MKLTSINACWHGSPDPDIQPPKRESILPLVFRPAGRGDAAANGVHHSPLLAYSTSIPYPSPYSVAGNAVASPPPPPTRSYLGKYLASIIIIRIYSSSPTAAHPLTKPSPDPLHACKSKDPTATIAAQELVSSRWMAGSGKSTRTPHAPSRPAGGWIWIWGRA